MTDGGRRRTGYDHVRAAARRLADGPLPDPTDQRTLIEGIWGLVEAAASKVCRRHPRGGVDMEEVVREFLDRKLMNERFLRSVAEARSIPALVGRTIHNLRIDLLRRSPAVVPTTVPNLGGTERAEDDDAQGFEGLLSRTADESSPTAEALLMGHEEECATARTLDQLFRDLSPSDRVLLKVTYCHHDLDDDVVAVVADRRGVTVDQVRREFSARAARLDERARVQQERLHGFYDRILALQRQLRMIDRVAAEKGDEQRAEAADSPAEPGETAVPKTMSALRKASAADRRRWRKNLDRRLAEVIRRCEENRQEPPSDLRGYEGWEEVARLIGELRDGAGDSERRRAVNRVTQRFGRLKRRLRAGRAGGNGRD